VIFPDDDYYDVLRLESDGVTPAAPDLYVHSIITDVTGADFYGGLLTDLQDVGYQFGVDLFTFPYDWRLSVSSNAALLDAVVVDALTAVNGTDDPSLWTVTQVNLVTHSMGGSVARAYIGSADQASRVHRVITIGTPQLGFPKMLKMILFGDPLQCLGPICPVDSAEVKDIVQNMSGSFDVLPSRAYWEFYDGSDGRLIVFQEDRDFDGDGVTLGALDHDQTKALLFNLDRDPNIDWDGTGKDLNQDLFNNSEAFHNTLDYSWDAGIPVPEIDLIVGTGQCTLGQIQPMYRISTTLPFPPGIIQIDPIVRLNYVNGDNTVPLFSASLYDPATGIDHRGGANVYYVDKGHTDHATLAAKEPVRQLVVNLLTGYTDVPEGISQSADVPRSCSGEVISVESPVNLHITDAAGNHTGLTSLSEITHPVVEQAIPGSWYNEVLESKSIYLPDEGVYTITLQATGAGNFNLVLRSYADEGLDQTILYLRAPLNPTTIGEVIYDTSSPEPPVLHLDHDADGIVDETITATSVLGPSESADAQAPTIEIISPTSSPAFAGAAPIVWQATDDGSGILNEWGIVDNGTSTALMVTNGSTVALPTGEHTLTVLAEDRFGNAAQQEVSFTVYSFAWRPPIGDADPYTAQSGRTIPVKFTVEDLSSNLVRDESVELRLVDAAGNTVAGPFFFAQNPNQGVTIQGDGQYHHNLRTSGLAPGTYILQVAFSSPQLGGQMTKSIILTP